MNFNKLSKIENYQFYIDVAMRRANESAGKLRGSGMKAATRFDRSKRIEVAKMAAYKDSLVGSMDLIIRSFPSIDDLAEFYKELIKITLDYPQLKKSLGAVNWARQKIIEFHREHENRLKKNENIDLINQIRKEYFGRAASTIKQIKKEIAYLEFARQKMRSYPSIKEMPCVAIAGFPNVGKSTLLSKLTTAKPEIANYAFTTKKLNLGIMKINGGNKQNKNNQNEEEIQLIDTPGTLNRFEKMNIIEKQAYLALRYLAKVIVFVFDPTESYSIEEQKKLLLEVKRFDKPIIVYVSKTDVADKKICDELIKRFNAVLFEDLKNEIEEKLKEQ